MKKGMDQLWVPKFPNEVSIFKRCLLRESQLYSWPWLLNYCLEINTTILKSQGLKFISFPYLLTLQLKRFAFDYNTLHRVKLNDRSVKGLTAAWPNGNSGCLPLTKLFHKIQWESEWNMTFWFVPAEHS